jgi:hypothetical protein
VSAQYSAWQKSWMLTVVTGASELRNCGGLTLYSPAHDSTPSLADAPSFAAISVSSFAFNGL